MEFGLYAWQPDGSVDRKLKEGAKTLVGTHGQWLQLGTAVEMHQGRLGLRLPTAAALHPCSS